MKKIVIVLALVLILAVGTAFADHPGGLGIGIVGFYPGGVGLSLKLPSVPVYWGISAALGPNYLGVAVAGDLYFIDRKLVPEIGLNWFLGLGLFFDFYTYTTTDSARTNYSYTYMDFGGRIPIGLSWQPISFLEIFLDIAPSLGLGIKSDEKWKVGNTEYKNAGSMGFHFGWPVELGLRLWL